LFCFQALASLERQQCCQICIETFSELLLPVAFSPSADVYRYVLSTWIKTRFPVEQNMAIAFVHTAMKNFPSMAATRHKRHQPTFNKDRSKSWFDGALRHLKLTLYTARTKKIRPSNASLVKSLTSHIDGIGDLLAQTVISVACIVGAIPTAYLTEAQICKETRTSTRLQANGFGPNKFPPLLRHLARTLNLNLLCTENSICEFGRTPRNPYVDVVYYDQKRILFVDGSRNSADFPRKTYSVSEILRDSSSDRTKRGKLSLSCGRGGAERRQHKWWEVDQVDSKQPTRDLEEIVHIVDVDQRAKNLRKKEQTEKRKALSLVNLKRKLPPNPTPVGVPVCIFQSHLVDTTGQYGFDRVHRIKESVGAKHYRMTQSMQQG
jgi:hypothetical protein